MKPPTVVRGAWCVTLLSLALGARAQDSTNGTWFNEAEIKQAREAAKKKEWIQPASDVLQTADELQRDQQARSARMLWQRLTHIPLDCAATRQARQRTGQAAK